MVIGLNHRQGSPVLCLNLTTKTMFKKIILSGLVLSFFSAPLFAQQTTPADAPAQTNARMGRNRLMGQNQNQTADAATRARKMTDRLTKQLGLDEATSQKVYTAALTRDQKIDDIRASSTDNRANAKSMKANADDFKTKLQGILTPDQFTKFEAMRHQGRKNQGSMEADTTNNDNH